MVFAINKGIHSGLRNRLRELLFATLLVVASVAVAQSPAIARELKSIQEVRDLLTDELAQYEKTLAVLLPRGVHPASSDNPAVKNIAAETLRIRQRLITITEREVTLIQQRIASYKAAAEEHQIVTEQSENPPLPDLPANYSLDDEAEDVARLLLLLTQYYADLQESLRTLPTEEELAAREAARDDAASLQATPFSADKVRLSGAEGITALAKISARLSDTSIAESRRDIAPICGIKTRYFGSLIASENRSLRPVGKNQYIARIRLQPGDTSLRIQTHQWELRLPQDLSATDYLVTLFMPRFGKPELHVFSIADLMAEEEPYLPAWLPDELNLKPQAG